MAYTSILAVHRLERSVEYVTNKDKTVRPRPDSALPHTRFAGQKNNLYNGKG